MKVPGGLLNGVSRGGWTGSQRDQSARGSETSSSAARTLAKLALTGPRPGAHGPGPPQARRRPGKPFPSRCTETIPRELVKTLLASMIPCPHRTGRTGCHRSKLMAAQELPDDTDPTGPDFFITKQKTLQDRVTQQINQASFFDFRYADRLAPVGRLKRGHMMNRLRFERVRMTGKHSLVVGTR